jgi:cytochrome c
MRGVALLATGFGCFAIAGAVAGAGPEAARGTEIYTRRQACHALQYNRTGPKHCGLFGRKAGTVPGFDYSPAMMRADFVWDEKTLDRFLANPPAVVPGTTMTYAGVADARERADLIAYLREADKSATCRPMASRGRVALRGQER